MKSSLKGILDINRLCDVRGRVHIYFVDVNNYILVANKLAENFFRDLLGCEKLIGLKCNELFEKANLNPTQACTKENAEVLETGLPKQFFQSWAIKCLYRLDLLTFKQPVYDSAGKPKGVLVISHILNMFSVENAYSMGLTKRQTECLFYLFEGHTAKEIAKIIKISPRTVEGYIETMRNKLNCTTLSELLLKALQCQVRTGLNHIIVSQNMNPFAGKDSVRIEWV